MKKKITYILVFLIIIAIFACGKVNASYIGKTVAKDTAGGNGYYVQGNNPGPNQLGDGVKGFYCLNHNLTFTPYTINRELDIHYKADGTIEETPINGAVTSRMQLTSAEKYAFAYLFGTDFGNPDTREIRQYSIWRLKGAMRASILDKWKVTNCDKELATAQAYAKYVAKKTQVKFYAGNEAKLEGEY